jgi:hypothetical protein
VPHLTIGHDAPIEALRAAARTIEAQLPIGLPVTAVRLIQGSTAPGSRHTVAEFPLGRID